MLHSESAIVNVTCLSLADCDIVNVTYSLYIFICCCYQRCDIVNAKVEPTDSECDWASEEEEDEENGKSDKTSSTVTDTVAGLTVSADAKSVTAAAPSATEPASPGNCIIHNLY